MAFVIQNQNKFMRFIYYDFPRHPLLVNYSNTYRPREEHKSLELSIMQTLQCIAFRLRGKSGRNGKSGKYIFRKKWALIYTFKTKTKTNQ